MPLVVVRHARFPRRVRPGLRQGLRARVRGRRDPQLLGQPLAAAHGRPLGLDAPKMLVQDRGRPARQDDLRHGVRRRAAASKSTARPRFVDATSSQSPATLDAGVNTTIAETVLRLYAARIRKIMDLVVVEDPRVRYAEDGRATRPSRPASPRQSGRQRRDVRRRRRRAGARASSRMTSRRTSRTPRPSSSDVPAAAAVPCGVEITPHRPAVDRQLALTFIGAQVRYGAALRLAVALPLDRDDVAARVGQARPDPRC